MKNQNINSLKKVPVKMLFVLGLFIIISNRADAQWLNDLNRHAEKKIEREATKRAEKKVDEQIDKGFDAAEESIEGGGTSDNKNEKNSGNKGTGSETQSGSNPSKEAGNSASSQSGNNGNANSSEGEAPQENVKPVVVWSKYDFVPGDVVVFEDGPGADEENGEFPSRWDLVKGQVEIASFNGENVIMFIDGNPEIVPYLKNAKEDYLPDVFTIEFDFYRPASGNRISVYLYDDKNQKNNQSMYMDISHNTISEKSSDVYGKYPDEDYSSNDKSRWIHVSIAYTSGKLKVYMDDARLINIPHYEGNPSGLSLQAYWADLSEDKAFYFKNIRIAEGGVKYYDRVLSDGKIVVNGIRFDVNKATLKPESMGPINKIYDLMEKNPELNFSVEGHTDSDGDEASNQALSEARAKTVMNQLISMGIKPDRLKSTGWGESKPLDNNASAEGKANNRRVEFVKF